MIQAADASQMCDAVIGMSRGAAINAILSRGYLVRIAKLEGVDRTETSDAASGRINLVIVDGLVTAESWYEP